MFKSPFFLALMNTIQCIHKGLHRTQIPVKGKGCLRHLWRGCDSDSPHNSLTRLDLGAKGCHFALHPFCWEPFRADTLFLSPLVGNFARSGKTSILQFNHSIVKRYRVTQIHIVGMSKGPAVDGVTKRDSLKQGLTDKTSPSCPTSQ